MGSTTCDNEVGYDDDQVDLMRPARYVHLTVDWALVGYADNEPHGVVVRLYQTQTKRDAGLVSHSAQVAEVVSLDYGLKTLKSLSLDEW